jgi:hypothetical protein
MSIANSTNNESYKHTGRIESPDCELLQRFLRPNGVRVYSRYGNDGRGGEGVDGGDETFILHLLKKQSFLGFLPEISYVCISIRKGRP